MPKRVTVRADSTADVDLALTLAAVSESIVVSAAQVELPLSRVTDSVTVIERAELQRLQIDGVAESLRFVPGFGVIQQGGRGALTSLFPRGGESDYTLVIADGIPLNAFGGSLRRGASVGAAGRAHRSRPRAAERALRRRRDRRHPAAS